MRTLIPTTLFALGLCVVGFAALNPQLEVRFSAGFVEYRGNTLGLGLVLLTLVLVGIGSRELVRRIADKTGKRKPRQIKP